MKMTLIVLIVHKDRKERCIKYLIKVNELFYAHKKLLFFVETCGPVEFLKLAPYQGVLMSLPGEESLIDIF